MEMKEDDDNPIDPELMHELNVALRDELMRRYEVVKAIHEDRVKTTSVVSKQRETLGEQLYNKQQELARRTATLQQLSLTHDSIQSDAESLRLQNARLKKDHAARKANLQDIQRKERELQNKLNDRLSMNDTLSTYNEKVAKEIAASRRVAYRTEEDIRKLESNKLAQDIEISRLDAQQAVAEEDVVLIDQQLQAQIAETQKAEQLHKQYDAKLAEIRSKKAHIEADLVEARQGAEARNMAMIRLKQALDEKQKEARQIVADINGVGVELRASELNQVLATQRQEKLEKAIDNERRLKLNQDQRIEELTLKLEELRQTQEEVARQAVDADAAVKKALRSKTADDREYRLAVDEKRSVLDEQSELLNDVRGVSAETKQYRADTRDLRSRTAIEQDDVARIDNEIARVRLDALAIEGRRGELARFQAEIEAEIAEKEHIRDSSDREMARMTDAIGKRSKEQDALNRKLGDLMQRDTGEGTGPLESTINSLTNEIKAASETAEAVQNRWLAAQSEYVNSNREIEATRQRSAKLSDELSVLEARKASLESKVDDYERQIRRLETEAGKLHRQHQELNQTEARQREEAAMKQAECTRLIRETEGLLEEWRIKCVAAEDKKDAFEADHDALRDTLALLEQQRMQVERQIQIERETQATLNPKEGQSDIDSLKQQLMRLNKLKSTLNAEITKQKAGVTQQIGRIGQSLGERSQKLRNPVTKKNPGHAVAADADRLQQRRTELAREVERAEAKLEAVMKDKTAIETRLEKLNAEQASTTKQTEFALHNTADTQTAKAVVDNARSCITNFCRAYESHKTQHLVLDADPATVRRLYARYVTELTALVNAIEAVVGDDRVALDDSARLRFMTLVRSGRGTLAGCATQIAENPVLDELVNDPNAASDLLRAAIEKSEDAAATGDEQA